MTGEQRQAAQEAFASEQVDVIVATVAFGMGIDRSNVRFVLHTAMPKSLEHYQQETGRAGRDGLEAECVLLYSGGDVFTFRSMLEKSGQRGRQRDAPAQRLQTPRRHGSLLPRGRVPARALVQLFRPGTTTAITATPAICAWATPRKCPMP